MLINSTGRYIRRAAQIKEISEPTTVDSHVTILRPNEYIDNLYFGYAVQMLEKNIENLAEGSTGQTELSRVRLEDEIFINCLPIKSQKKIGLILSNIDKKIELNNQINKNLTKLIDTGFKNYLLNFDNYSEEDLVSSVFGPIPKDGKLII